MEQEHITIDIAKTPKLTILLKEITTKKKCTFPNGTEINPPARLGDPITSAQ